LILSLDFSTLNIFKISIIEHLMYLQLNMKKSLLFILVLLYFGLFSYSQDVQFSPAVTSSGGSSPSSFAVNLSRWRIGEIHVVTFPSDAPSLKQAEVASTLLTHDPPDDWSVSVYPNPVSNRLKICFETNNSGEFAFEITDITGRKLFSQKAKHILPGQVTEIDFSGYAPNLYLLSIIPSGELDRKLFKITKE
jgi:hypothetical protein